MNFTLYERNMTFIIDATVKKHVGFIVKRFDRSKMPTVREFWEHTFGHLVVCLCCPVCVLA